MLMSQLMLRSEEFISLLVLKYGQTCLSKRTPLPLSKLADRPSKEFCYLALTKVSRSFALVIQRLCKDFRDSICVFYLVLRGLDTIEDDMAISVDKKVDLLTNFYKKLEISDQNIDGIGYNDELVLLQNFGHVISVYKSLDKNHREIISRSCKNMGEGMAKFAGSLIMSINSVSQYNEYCHYVAGLVGIGLTDLFKESGYEDFNKLSEPHVPTLANSMGLFLQKTNIIRDYLEDLNDGRTQWPKEIWSKFSPCLEQYKDNQDSDKALECLNEMICDALSSLPHCLDYMKRIQNRNNFEFCAVPQIMAIATLAKIYDNRDVFRRNVKIRRGLTAKLMIQTKNYESFCKYTAEFCREIINKMSQKGSYFSRKQLLKEKTFSNSGNVEISTIEKTKKLLINIESDIKQKQLITRQNSTYNLLDYSQKSQITLFLFFILLAYFYLTVFGNK